MSTENPRGDRRPGLYPIPTESLFKKPPIPKKPVGFGQTDPAQESFAKKRATFDQMLSESIAKPPAGARKPAGFNQTAPASESFAKIRATFNQIPDGSLQKKPPIARKRACFKQIPPARPLSSLDNYPPPPPVPPTPPYEDGGYDMDSTVYYDPWSPNFPVQLPISTPSDAELHAAESNPFSFSPSRKQESPMFPARYKFDPDTFFTSQGSIRSGTNFEYHLDTPSPLLRPPPPVPPRRKPPVPLPRTKFPPRETDDDQAFSQITNPFAKPGPHDDYVGSSVVVGLTAKTFTKFIKDVDAAFVLFYDPGDEDGAWAKAGVKKAAEVTKKENHVFAAVDCTKERELCRKQKVLSVPTMKLFVKGMTVDTYGNVPLLPAEIRQYVENAPNVKDTAVVRNRCQVQ
ncbi:unnamed protein product [Candidula unifasciata]|uniref:Thioredoxin domain-containing protein n=1 Tax=Candidula unifasciata TaxID=100452 RepID=A0A8S3YDT7_9EUPU|nr:unnamed protein product [Candidula unifasciata]